MQSSTYFISVIIPVFNDSRRLKLCLEALQHQKKDTLDFDYEVIVVDNNSTENIREVCDTYQALYLLERQKGSYAARNAGIQIAKGDYLAFTDSDCIPDHYWLEKGLHAFLEASPKVGLVGGAIELFTSNKKKTLGDIFDFAFAFPQETYIHSNHFAATANVITTKEVMEKVGLFNNSMASGGDYEWGQRVFNAGLSLVFAHDAVVKHPTRSDVKAIIKKSYRVSNNFYNKYHQSKAPLHLLFKYIYELVGIHIPISQSLKKLRALSQPNAFSTTQKLRLFLLLCILHFVKTYSKVKEWFKLRVALK